jgi:hypothetical protein
VLVGLFVPTPTFPAEVTKRAEVPVDVATFITDPVPSCWTLRAVPVLVLPKMEQFEVFKVVFTVGVP